LRKNEPDPEVGWPDWDAKPLESIGGGFARYAARVSSTPRCASATKHSHSSDTGRWSLYPFGLISSGHCFRRCSIRWRYRHETWGSLRT
jgi:hypothetical protein